MAARIRHIALCVKDIDATADFYEKAFGLKRSKKNEGKTAWSVYMSDGEVNIALLQYKSEVGSGVDPSWTGIHHVGIYIGGNQMIHSPHTGDVVKISSLTGWYSSTYVGARRM